MPIGIPEVDRLFDPVVGLVIHLDSLGREFFVGATVRLLVHAEREVIDADRWVSSARLRGVRTKRTASSSSSRRRIVLQLRDIVNVDVTTELGGFMATPRRPS